MFSNFSRAYLLTIGPLVAPGFGVVVVHDQLDRVPALAAGEVRQVARVDSVVAFQIGIWKQRGKRYYFRHAPFSRKIKPER